MAPSSGIFRSPNSDGAALLTVYLVALLAVPALLVVPALGTAGSPATMLSLAGLVAWLLHHTRRTVPVDLTGQPLRRCMFLFVLVTVLVYVHAMMRPIPFDELNPADSGVLRVLGWSAVVLIAVDGIESMDRVHVLLRRLTLAVGLVAVVGAVQFVTKQLWVDQIHIPGLSSRGAEMVLSQRSGRVRVSGTSIHPLEFGIILTTTMPLVVVHALHAPRRRWLYKCVLIVVALVIFLVISRAATICAAVGIIVMALRWTWRERAVALAFLLTTMTFVYLIMPGMLGLLTGLFTGAGNDPSVASRTDSYHVAFALISRSPLLGRGFGTLTTDYWIFDNAYLLDLIDAGVIGTLALVVLMLAGMASAQRARTWAAADFDRELAHAVFAGLLSVAVGMAFFDLLAFPQAAGVFFLLLGMAGALRRLTDPRAQTVGMKRVEAPGSAHRDGAAVRPDVAAPDVAGC